MKKKCSKEPARKIFSEKEFNNKKAVIERGSFFYARNKRMKRLIESKGMQLVFTDEHSPFTFYILQ
jgi:hypothetical protein